MNDIGTLLPLLIAIVTAGLGSLAGLAAFRKAGPEATKAASEAATTLLGSASAVVLLLREQMKEMAIRLDASESRIDHLEEAVESWESWADKVLALLDSTLLMVTQEQRDGMDGELQKVRRSRPPRLGTP